MSHFESMFALLLGFILEWALFANFPCLIGDIHEGGCLPGTVTFSLFSCPKVQWTLDRLSLIRKPCIRNLEGGPLVFE